MPRERVPESFRQRTAKACHSCQQRKQKCAGGQPCDACTKRNIECTFGTNDPSSSDSSSSPGPQFTHRQVEEATGLRSHLTILDRLGSQWQDESMRGQVIDSHQSITSGQDEDSEVPRPPRRLPDPTGRVLFLGGAATFNYLQAICVNIEEVAGQSQFTLKPQRHPIIGPRVNTPHQILATPMLLENKVVDLLVKYYFTNTHGLLNILDQREFRKSLSSWHSSPGTVKPSSLCLIYLVLAIGLAIASPWPESPEDAIITGIRSHHVDQADCYFRNAEHMANNVSEFEDGDLWSIQAISLMSVYTLTLSKWNTAYNYLGTAVRSAYALGLHIGPDIATNQNEPPAERRNLWRSLFVLDRFFAASLGWPLIISEGACSEDSLEAPPATRTWGNKKRRRSQSIGSCGLDACVQASEIVSQVLNRVYSGTQISTQVAHEIADACKRLARKIDPTLDLVNLFNTNPNPARDMAILHAQLFGWHAIFLLTRPFFLHMFSKVQLNGPGSQAESQQPNQRQHLLSEACVAASMQIIRLVRHVFESRRLPQTSPFVMHLLFAAALTVLSNEYAHVHVNDDHNGSIMATINIMSYSSKYEAQSQFLRSFQQVVLGQAAPGVSGGPIQSSYAMYRAAIPTFSFEAAKGLHFPSRQSGESESYPPNPPRQGRPNSDRSACRISQVPMNDQRKAPRGLTESGPASRGLMVSPANSAASLPQPTGVSDRLGMDQEGAGTIGSQDPMYWTFVHEMGLVSQVQTPGSGSGGMTQEHSAETGESSVMYSHPAHGIADESTNQFSDVVSNLTGVFYPPEPQTEFGG